MKNGVLARGARPAIINTSTVSTHLNVEGFEPRGIAETSGRR